MHTETLVHCRSAVRHTLSGPLSQPHEPGRRRYYSHLTDEKTVSGIWKPQPPYRYNTFHLNWNQVLLVTQPATSSGHHSSSHPIHISGARKQVGTLRASHRHFQLPPDDTFCTHHYLTTYYTLSHPVLFLSLNPTRPRRVGMVSSSGFGCLFSISVSQVPRITLTCGRSLISIW